jgi:hypothetical protein
MSMPGFVYHFDCPSCGHRSYDYSLYVFPSTFEAGLVLPAWSRKFQCYATVMCDLTSEQRTQMKNDRAKLKEAAAMLSSSAMTVGVPNWNLQNDTVEVEPAPICPRCGNPARAVMGYPGEDKK